MLRNIVQLFKAGQFNSIVIYGATASGKSELALMIANELQDALIINADSMQVYSDIPIITAQPQELSGHHLYGFIPPDDHSFSVARWLSLVAEIVNASLSIPIIVGGTGMYISNLINGLTQIPPIPLEITQKLIREMELYGLTQLLTRLAAVDPYAASKISDPQRVIRALAVYEETGQSISHWQKHNLKYIDSSKIMKIWVKPQRDILYERINSRFIKMLEIGVVDEAELVMHKYKTYPKAIGLQEIEMYLENKILKNQMIALSQQRSRNYAKRQETWFKNQLLTDITISIPPPA
jgi:tRNA dimethylallyltransferase